jgi:cytochrome b6-f complex iron-sulfur subunit
MAQSKKKTTKKQAARTEHPAPDTTTRRGFLSSLAMGAGLVASMGALGAIGVKFLMPRKKTGGQAELFIGKAASIPQNTSAIIHDLSGAEIIVLNTSEGFKGFSNVCPHLGCHVHWEEEKKIFYCPCHEGVFDASGTATSGPPAEAKQKLAAAEIRHDKKSGNLFLVTESV